MDDKLKEIIEVSEKLFKEYGIRSISMDDVCKHIGISKKTLYKYVDNKQDLLRHIFNNAIERHKAFRKVIVNKGLNAIDVLLEVSTLINKNFKAPKSSIFELEKYYPAILKEFMEKKRTLIYNDLIDNMQHGIKDGLYRDDLQVELIARLYVKKMEDIEDSDILKNCNFTFEDFFKVMFENHIRAIANEKGIKYFEEKVKNLKPNKD